MYLVKPSYEILSPLDRAEMLQRLEIAGRTCYRSEDKITEDSASKFVEMITKRGHNSVIEHASLTARFVCDRGVTHELVRHRLASFSQSSTRYCNYSKDKFGNQLSFIIPSWTALEEGEYEIRWEGEKAFCDNLDLTQLDPADHTWFSSMVRCEMEYMKLLDMGWTPQEARSVLPNSLKTEIVTTANLREWMHILDLRTSPAAHPQIIEVMKPLQDELHTLLPEIF